MGRLGQTRASMGKLWQAMTSETTTPQFGHDSYRLAYRKASADYTPSPLRQPQRPAVVSPQHIFPRQHERGLCDAASEIWRWPTTGSSSAAAGQERSLSLFLLFRAGLRDALGRAAFPPPPFQAPGNKQSSDRVSKRQQWRVSEFGWRKGAAERHAQRRGEVIRGLVTLKLKNSLWQLLHCMARYSRLRTQIDKLTS
jgi:hypothetical protein